MSSLVYVFDPTEKDKQSQVRGIGRYLQILKENFAHRWIFTDKIKQISADSIFINPFYNFLQPPLIMKRISQKQIAIIHDLIPLKYPNHFPIGIKGKINLFLNKLSLKNYDLIITDSQASKKDILQILGVDENKVKVIYPCLPKIFSEIKLKTENSKLKTKAQVLKLNKKRLKDLRFEFEISDFRFNLGNYCLYVGDATWNKNLVNIAQAIKIANISSVFVGKIFENHKLKIENFNHPWEKQLKQFIKETKNDRRFIFVGFVTDEELIKLYQQARCNILFSRDEGFGFSYLEASSQECPSVLADIPVLREIAAGNALFADPKNINDLADKIGQLYYEQKIREEIGQKARQRSHFFSSSQFKKSFFNILRNL